MGVVRTPPKGLLVDNLGHCSLIVVALFYFVFFFSAVGVGVNGPKTFSSASNPTANLARPCEAGTSINNCKVTWFGTLTDMSPYHQFMWLTLVMDRPTETGSGLPALQNFDVSWNAVYQVDVVGVRADGMNVLLAQNQTHIVPISFRKGSVASNAAYLFMTQEISYVTYRITVRFLDALGAFADASVSAPMNNLVKMNFEMNFVNKDYTNFELGWKMFFVTTSGLIWLMYSGLLCW
jgi:hypothetical protein